MGNCLRNGSPAASNNHHRRFAANKEADDPGSPTLTYASSTVYYAAKSHFSETASEGNWDASTGYLIMKHLKARAEHGANGASPELKAYSFAQLKAATGNFEEHYLIGEEGSGKVYKGWIDERTFAPSKPGSGMIVAVKKMSSSLLALREWESGVSFWGRQLHPNLIKLLGFCFEYVESDTKVLLVYEFMPNGSLADHLFKKNPPIEPLSWNLRLKIAIGVARGIAFLHSLRVIHRSVKPSNILLDENYNAKLSDFCYPKEGPAEGNYGYAAPKCIETGHLRVKSDVYGFGVVLLEMMTGLRAIDSRRPSGQQNLVDWLKPMLTNKKGLKDVTDASMKGQYSSKAMLSAAKITSKCLEVDPRSRPSMDEVVNVLEQIESMKEKPK